MKISARLGRVVMGLLVVVGVGLGGAGCNANQAPKANLGAPAGTGFVVKHLGGTEEGRKYGVFVPHGYDAKKAYPVILFLHGAFEGGSNPETAFSVGLGSRIAAHAKTFEYIAVFPQTHSDWAPKSKDLADAYAALQEVKKAYHVDESREYVTGLSIGGLGVWALAEQHPGEWAALVPMCAYDKVDAVPVIKTIPVWAFHNTMDMFVMVGDSEAMIDAIKKQNPSADARLTKYGAVGHDCWSRAYNEEELWTWLGKQQRGAGAAAGTAGAGGAGMGQ